MKRKMTLSLVLALSVLMSLVSLPAGAQGQQRQRFRADTGVITIGAQTVGGQILRVTAVNAEAQDGSGTDNANFIVRKMEYGQGACSGGVCRLAVESQTTTDPIRLAPGEAASVDVTPMANSSGVRVVVLSNSQDVRLAAQIVDSVTGKVVAVFDMFYTNSPGGGLLG